MSTDDKQGIEKSGAANPANEAVKRVRPIDFTPMDMPNATLAVPDMPGFYLYWHLGKNVNRALRHGYTFVEENEVELENKGLANGAAVSGSTDLGSRISVSAKETGDDVADARLYLMKLPLEIHEGHMKLKTEKNEEIAQAIRGGMLGAGGDPDSKKRYMKEGQHLFYPKANR